MIYNSRKESFDFNAFKTIRTFGEDIYNSKITINEADQEQADLINYVSNFTNKARTRSNIDKKNKENILDSVEDLYYGRELVLSTFKSGLFKLKPTAATGFKILTPKQVLQRLPMALAQVKAGNNSESLLNEIKQIVYSLYQSKEITKRVYNNIIKFIQ